MNDGGSLAQFFFNSIPGGIFIISLFKFKVIEQNLMFQIVDMNLDWQGSLFIFIVISLFLGFVLQGITKIIREAGLNEWMAYRVAVENKYNKEIIKDIYNELNPNHKIKQKDIKDDIDKERLHNTFYLMDNYLRGYSAGFLPTHNSSRFAFWSNIFLANFLLLSLLLIRNSYLDSGFFILQLLFVFFGWLTYKTYFSYYDSILKSYYMKTTFKDTNCNEKR